MAQVWPTLDAFPYGSPVYGQAVIGYLGFRLAAEPYGYGRLMSGYGAGVAALREDTGGAVGAGVMRRQVFPADVRVSMVHRIHAVVGSATYAQFQGAAVLARIQGGSLAGDGTPQVRYEDVTAYAFTAQQGPVADTVRFRLVRWSGGSEVVLATEDASAADIGHFLTDVTMTLEVQDNGPDVDLVAYVQGLGLAAPLGVISYQPGGTGLPTVLGSANPASPAPGVGTILLPPAGVAPKGKGFAKPPQLVQVLAVTDSGGGIITGTGRCGFLADVEQNDGAGILTVSAVASFQVDDLTGAGDTTVWRDEWSRAALDLGESITDAHGTIGRNLGSDYSTDQASVETTTPLTRSTSEEAAEVDAQMDFGNAVDLNGTQRVDADNPANVMDPPAPAASLAVSIAQWWRVDVNADCTLYDAYDSTTDPDEGIRVQWKDAGGGNAYIQVQLGGKSTVQTFDTPTFVASTYLNQTFCFVVTYMAQANTSTGEGRVRVYIGRFGMASLIGTMTVPADTRPVWTLAVPHRVGASVDGVVDSMAVFYAELTQAQADTVCDQLADPQDFIPYGLQHAVDFETFNDNSPGSDDEYQPWYPAGVTTVADWWHGVNIPDTVQPGLVPQPEAPLVVWHQRPADDLVAQSRKVKVRPASGFSVAGVAVRGTPSSTPGAYTAYRMDVAPGTAAAVHLYRVINGTATKIATIDPAAPINVPTGAYTELQLTVQQQDDAGPSGPVLLSATIGGAAVTWVTVGAAGVALDINADVVDLSSDRILSGAATGLHTLVDTVASRIDDWDAGTVTPPEPDPADFANYPMPAEDDGATGDLGSVIDVDWIIEPVHHAPRKTTAFESGHGLRLALSTYERRQFSCRKVLSPSEYTAFLAFWDAHQGPVIGFAWDPGAFLPNIEQAGTFHFVEDSMEVRRRGRLNHEVHFVLEERRASPSP